MLEITLNLNKWTVICQKSCNFVAKKQQKIKMTKMTRLLVMFAAVVLSLSAAAIPVKPRQWRTPTLADSTTVRAEEDAVRVHGV